MTPPRPEVPSKPTYACIRDELAKLTEQHPCWPLYDATRVAALDALVHLEKIGLPAPKLWAPDIETCNFVWTTDRGPRVILVVSDEGASFVVDAARPLAASPAAPDSPWGCSEDLMNWINTFDTQMVDKAQVYRWAMEWRPPSLRREAPAAPDVGVEEPRAEARYDLAIALAKNEGVELPPVTSTTLPGGGASLWRTYLGRADDVIFRLMSEATLHAQLAEADDHKATILEQGKRIAELEAGLRPFHDAARRVPRGFIIVELPYGMLVGDLRRARALLSTPQPAPDAPGEA